MVTFTKKNDCKDARQGTSRRQNDSHRISEKATEKRIS